MIALGLIAAVSAGLTMRSQTQTPMKKRMLDGNKNIADNNRSKLLFSPERIWKENIKLGNWAWGRPAIPSPVGTKAYFRKPPPREAGYTDWSLEGNQWLRSKEYRDLYVKTYRNAWSTELAYATRNQLVPGFWHETITKGRVLQQECHADGRYNPDGPNLYKYASP